MMCILSTLKVKHKSALLSCCEQRADPNIMLALVQILCNEQRGGKGWA